MTMEWKIGKIKQVNGEWYQCVVAIQGCRECSFRTQDYCTRRSKCTSTERSDKTSVIFKKLEKVGEPYSDYCPSGRVIYFQKYKCYQKPIYTGDIVYWADDIHISLEIKQTKEEMEEKKLNLKPFDIQKAREGKPVCTRDGRKARIICFDRRLFYKNVSYPILALVERSDGEDDVCGYNEKGKVLIEDGAEYKDDLMMLPEKKEGWVNVYYDNDASSHRGCRAIYDTKEQAVKYLASDKQHIATVKIEWEE